MKDIRIQGDHCRRSLW